MQQISMQLSNELGANEQHADWLLATNTPELKETGTNGWFFLPGSELENNFSVIITPSHRKIPLLTSNEPLSLQ